MWRPGISSTKSASNPHLSKPVAIVVCSLTLSDRLRRVNFRHPRAAREFAVVSGDGGNVATLTWVERTFGYATARAYAGHHTCRHGTTATYVKADLFEIATALSALTQEPHPLLLAGNNYAADIRR